MTEATPETVLNLGVSDGAFVAEILRPYVDSASGALTAEFIDGAWPIIDQCRAEAISRLRLVGVDSDLISAYNWGFTAGVRAKLDELFAPYLPKQ